ncbi:MAG: hypothetical protein IIB83_09410 [Bacteroidetes bacterium]|nr:hypothetical protein [Bacteroidota bacterium]
MSDAIDCNVDIDIEVEKNIFPLIKADTRLEDAAIKSLRQWRFEPLVSGQSEVVQTAVINFPYRLK